MSLWKRFAATLGWVAGVEGASRAAPGLVEVVKVAAGLAEGGFEVARRGR